eukprot:jgi/Botrbrau1/10644/Bobra.53_2s0003.1
MHTWLYRSNALFTVASTTLGVMCILASLTDLIHQKPPVVKIYNVTIEGLEREYGHDRAYIRVKAAADLRPLFTWNTKQVFAYLVVEFKTVKNHLNQVVIWNRIIQRIEDANIPSMDERVMYPYTLTDQGFSLVKSEFNVTFAWESIPIVGALHTGRDVFTGYHFPSEYIRASREVKGGYY